MFTFSMIISAQLLAAPVKIDEIIPDAVVFERNNKIDLSAAARRCLLVFEFLRHHAPKIIHEFCKQGDALAIEVFRRTGKMLGFVMAGYASIFDPEAIIFTGGIAGAGHYLLIPASEEFEKHVFHNTRGHVKFLVSALEDHERDVLGASALAWGIKEYSLFK